MKGCWVQIGKMLVYESGAVKMQLGDVLFDVLPGTEAAFRQDIAAVSAADQACVFLGGVQQRVVACPDIGHLLRWISDPPDPSKCTWSSILPCTCMLRLSPWCMDSHM
jgi:hypothetical protein